MTSVPARAVSPKPGEALGAAGIGSVWKTIAQTSGARSVTIAANVVTLALTARWLGPKGQGVIAGVIAWATLFFTVAYLSLGQVAIRRATQCRDESWLRPVFGALLAVTAVVAAVTWSVVALLYASTSGGLFEHLPAGALALGLLFAAASGRGPSEE